MPLKMDGYLVPKSDIKVNCNSISNLFLEFFLPMQERTPKYYIKKSVTDHLELKMMKVLIKRIKRLLVPLEYCACNIIKVLFTDHCRWQNFGPSLLRLVDRLYKLIHKMQKTRKKLFCDGQSE